MNLLVVVVIFKYRTRWEWFQCRCAFEMLGKVATHTLGDRKLIDRCRTRDCRCTKIDGNEITISVNTSVVLHSMATRSLLLNKPQRIMESIWFYLSFHRCSLRDFWTAVRNNRRKFDNDSTALEMFKFSLSNT